MVSQKWKVRWGNLKIWFRDWTHVFSAVGLGFGIIFMVLTGLAMWYKSALPEGFLLSFTEENGRLDICTGVIGLGLVVLAGYYFADNMNNRRKFSKLYNISKKEKFIKNRDQLEELAFLISTKHELMVQKKVKEMKLR